MLEGLNKNGLLNTDFDFILVNNDIELSEATDPDLMKIKCFACHEGVNANSVEFLRSTLKVNLRTFIDKPVFIVIGKDGLPQGHGFDYKSKKFSSKDRKQVGHIVNAYPCIVDLTGKITDVSYMDEQDYPDGEFRVICDLVIYKQYVSEIADLLAVLHLTNNLKFSMESVCDYVITDDGIKHCTSIHFTGLAIVKTPAFENSFSLEIAQKEEDLMDYEKLYNEEHSRVETLVAEKTVLETEKTTLVADKAELETQLLSAKEELAEVNGKLVEANAEIETLNTYKEKVETAEKLVVGKTRLEKISKYVKTEKTAEELAEVSQEEYVTMLAEAVDNYVPTKENRILGLPNTNTDTKLASKKDRLVDILEDLIKEV